MTTSGNGLLNPVRAELVLAALRLCGVYNAARNPRPDKISEANEALNLMLKSWQVENGLWLKQFCTVFTAPGQHVYSLPGANGSPNITKASLTSLSGTALVVDSTTGIAAANIIGVKLADGSIHWDTVASVDSATGITLTTGTAEAATAGDPVYAYAANDGLFRPTRVFGATRLDESGYEVPLLKMSRSDYMEQTSKYVEGTPVEFYFDAQLGTAKLYLRFVPPDSRYRIVLDCDRPIHLMLDAGNTYDVPMEWLEMIKYGLATRLAPEYSLPIGERQMLEAKFTALRDGIVSYNIDHVSTYFQPGE